MAQVHLDSGVFRRLWIPKSWQSQWLPSLVSHHPHFEALLRWLTFFFDGNMKTNFRVIPTGSPRRIHWCWHPLRITKIFSFWGSKTLTGTFIATFALSMACNIYTITFAKFHSLSGQSIAEARPIELWREKERTTIRFFHSSLKRTRAFCGHCGTNVNHQIWPMVEGFPDIFDVVLGTVDREGLEVVGGWDWAALVSFFVSLVEGFGVWIDLLIVFFCFSEF